MTTGKILSNKILPEMNAAQMTKPLEQISHNLNIAKQCLRFISNEVSCQSRDLRVKFKNLHCELDQQSRLHKEFAYYDASLDLLKITLALINDLEISTREVNQPEVSNNEEIFVNELDQYEKEFRHTLVDLMVVSVQCWERSTGKDKLSLAEESKLWRVSVDNGQLRVRTLNRYLSIKTLPTTPRWKTVLATGHYVYRHSNPNLELSHELKKVIDYTTAILRKRALL